MMSAREVLITSSRNFCIAVSHIDGKPVGGKDPALLKSLQDALSKELWDYVAARKCGEPEPAGYAPSLHDC
jgi:D-alanine transaminase